jgi:hypothetical protein
MPLPPRRLASIREGPASRVADLAGPVPRTVFDGKRDADCLMQCIAKLDPDDLIRSRGTATDGCHLQSRSD